MYTLAPIPEKVVQSNKKAESSSEKGHYHQTTVSTFSTLSTTNDRFPTDELILPRKKTHPPGTVRKTMKYLEVGLRYLGLFRLTVMPLVHLCQYAEVGEIGCAPRRGRRVLAACKRAEVERRTFNHDGVCVVQSHAERGQYHTVRLPIATNF